MPNMDACRAGHLVKTRQYLIRDLVYWLLFCGEEMGTRGLAHGESRGNHTPQLTLLEPLWPAKMVRTEVHVRVGVTVQVFSAPIRHAALFADSLDSVGGWWARLRGATLYLLQGPMTSGSGLRGILRRSPGPNLASNPW